MAADDRRNEAINAERSRAIYADASASFFDGQSVVGRDASGAGQVTLIPC